MKMIKIDFIGELPEGKEVFCLHCERSFRAGDVVTDQAGLQECPVLRGDGTKCDGSPLDWRVDGPWNVGGVF
jgi:hypothetical protein